MQLTDDKSDACVPLRVVFWMSLIVTCICLYCTCVLQQSLCCKCHAVNFNKIPTLITVGQFGLRCFHHCCLQFTLFVFYIVDCCNLARLARWILFEDIMTVETIVWQKLVLTSTSEMSMSLDSACLSWLQCHTSVIPLMIVCYICQPFQKCSLNVLLSHFMTIRDIISFLWLHLCCLMLQASSVHY